MRFLCSVAVVALLTLPVVAAAPPAAELLPADTLALFSVPDWEKAAAQWNASPQGRLWQDPAIKPFREKLTKHWKEEFAAPLEQALGARLKDYADLLRGQVSVALTENGWGSQPDAEPGVILLVDTRDQQDALKDRLNALKKKWVESGRKLKIDKVHGVELATFVTPDNAPADKARKGTDAASEDNDGAGEGGSKKPLYRDITVAQSGPLLIVGTAVKDLERVLARQSGGLAPALSDQASYEANRARLFREALAFGWINFARFYDALEKQLKPSGRAAAAGGSLVPRSDRILAATGLNGLKTIAGRLTAGDEGAAAEIVLSVPEGKRQGVFRLLPSESKEASPPGFVPSDVLKFSRWRLDGQKAWKTLESMLTSVAPELTGLLQMGLEAAGKEKDPNFDLKKALVGNLGDDFISLQRAPRSPRSSDLAEPPSLLLIGSPNPDQLVQGLKAATALMPLMGGEPALKEREFLGRKIYSVSLSPDLGGEESASNSATPRTFTFVASGGYAALSTDSAMVEDYVRSIDAPAKPLRELAGLSEAAQKVGGMNTGLFGYQNQAEGMRLWLDSAKQQSIALDKLLSLAPLSGSKDSGRQDGKNTKDWIDVSLLPSFEQISKYLHFIVYSLSTTEEGMSWKVFAPVPPRMKAEGR